MKIRQVSTMFNVGISRKSGLVLLPISNSDMIVIEDLLGLKKHGDEITLKRQDRTAQPGDILLKDGTPLRFRLKSI